MLKTNAIRILEKNKINYEEVTYDPDKKFTSGLESSEKLHIAPFLIYKTIVTFIKTNYYVFVLPVDKEINLKLAAKLVNEKSLDLLPTKDLLAKTGYIRGGCSPIGMKKLFPTYLDNNVKNLEYIYVSAGKIGYQIKINPNDLLNLINAKYANFTLN